MATEDWLESYQKKMNMFKELVDSDSNTSIYHDPSKLKYMNSINSILMRIKVLIDELSYMDTMYKLKNLQTDRLSIMEGTLRNIENALIDVKRNLI